MEDGNLKSPRLYASMWQEAMRGRAAVKQSCVATASLSNHFLCAGDNDFRAGQVRKLVRKSATAD